jgi:hypothetical protein
MNDWNNLGPRSCMGYKFTLKWNKNRQTWPFPFDTAFHEWHIIHTNRWKHLFCFRLLYKQQLKTAYTVSDWSCLQTQYFKVDIDRVNLFTVVCQEELQLIRRFVENKRLRSAGGYTLFSANTLLLFVNSEWERTERGWFRSKTFVNFPCVL